MRAHRRIAVKIFGSGVHAVSDDGPYIRRADPGGQGRVVEIAHLSGLRRHYAHVAARGNA